MFGTIFLPSFSFREIIGTPLKAEGLFYPDSLPESTDIGLVKNVSSTIETGGKILNIIGSILNRDYKPIEGTTAEIWQTDMNGVYHYKSSFGNKMRDNQFQGFGRSITDQNGCYSFRTIILVEYSGRTPHIHLKLWDEMENISTTQLYLHGHSLNNEDFFSIE